MSMFDSIINETEKKFNLGDKAGTIFSALLALMTDKTRGGLAGFLEKFNRAGLSKTTSSWIYTGANTPLSNKQLESVLGADTINDIARQTGTDYTTITLAAAYLVPRMIDALTPNGVVPPDSDLQSRNSDDYFAETVASATDATTAETFDRIGTAAADTLDTDKRIVSDDINTIDAAYPVGDRVDNHLNRADGDFVDDEDNSPLRWLMPLLLLGLLLILGYWFCGKSPTPTATNVNMVNTNTIVANQ